MAVRLVVTITAREGRGSEYARVFTSRLVEVRSEKGCIQYDLFQNVERPDKLVLLERWTDDDALAAHLELSRKRKLIGQDLREGSSMEKYESA